MNKFLSKRAAFSGTQYAEVYKKAFTFYSQLVKNTKRKPYIRSAYFDKDKIFLGLFWSHLHQKNWKDRRRRVALFPCGIDLLKNSRFQPAVKNHPLENNSILYRFEGQTLKGETFYVHVKENKKTKTKWLLSIFPD